MLLWTESRGDAPAALAWCERSWNRTVSQGSAGPGGASAGVASSRTGGEGQPTVDRGPLHLMEPCEYWALSLKMRSPQRTSQIRLDVLFHGGRSRGGLLIGKSSDLSWLVP